MVKRLWQAWLRWEFRNFRAFDWRSLLPKVTFRGSNDETDTR